MEMKLNLLSQQEIDELNLIIENSERIVVCAHKGPDGDAVGSVLAWAEYLQQRGKSPAVVLPDAWPDFLQWMPNAQTIIRYDKHPEQVEQLLREADVVFCLDMNATERVLAMQTALEESTPCRVVIDHHLDPTLPAKLTLSFPELSSTCETVFRIIYQLDAFEQMTKSMATCIYCGMMTDTGAFTYNSTRPEIYTILGLLLTKRIDKDRIYRRVYNTFSHWALRLRGYVIYRKMNVLENGRASYFSLTRQEMSDFHFIRGDVEGLVNEPLRIRGMRLSISLREDDRVDNLVWVSLRSYDDFPCNKMAEEFFNGGGHLNASGGRLNCSIEEAEQITRKAIAAYSELLK